MRNALWMHMPFFSRDCGLALYSCGGGWWDRCSGQCIHAIAAHPSCCCCCCCCCCGCCRCRRRRCCRRAGCCRCHCRFYCYCCCCPCRAASAVAIVATAISCLCHAACHAAYHATCHAVCQGVSRTRTLWFLFVSCRRTLARATCGILWACSLGSSVSALTCTAKSVMVDLPRESSSQP